MLQEANVVGMTTTGVAMNQSLVEALGARIMVVEEAAEVTKMAFKELSRGAILPSP